MLNKDCFKLSEKKFSGVPGGGLLLAAVLALSGSSNAAYSADSTPTLGDNSTYTLTEVGAYAAGQNIVTKYNSDLSSTYYQVLLKTSSYGSSSTLTVNGVDGNFSIGIPAAGSGTLSGTTYSGNYVSLSKSGTDSTTYGGAIEYTADSTSYVFNSNFINNSATDTGGIAQGGGMMMNSATAGAVHGDFVGNRSRGENPRGGGLSLFKSVLTTLDGHFIGNHIDVATVKGFGGGLYVNDHSTIQYVNSDFIGNYIKGATWMSGGAIALVGGGQSTHIDNVKGDFIGNYAQATSTYAEGGAISAWGTKGFISIEGDFIENYVKAVTYAHGGAISNYSFQADGNTTIEALKGYFTGNYASAADGRGGAIYNGDYGIINSIEGEFIKNYAVGTTSSQGGAIYNKNIMAIKNALFAGNYVTGGTAQGGALYNAGTLSLLDVTFNAAAYVDHNGSTILAKNDIFNTSTISVAGTNTFASDISGTGTMNFGTGHLASTIKAGVNNQNLNFTTGTFNLYSNAFNAGAVATGANTVVNLGGDDTINTYNAATFDSDASTSYSLDMNIAADKTVTVDQINAAAGSGTVTINTLNFLNGVDPTGNPFRVHVLTGGSALKLALNSAISDVDYYISQTDRLVYEELVADVTSDKKFIIEHQDGELWGNILVSDDKYLELKANDAKTDWYEESLVYVGDQGDSLKLINQTDKFADTNRSFTITDADQNYVVSEDIGSSGRGTFSVNGSEAVDSTLDINGHVGFVLDDATTLKLNNLTLTNGLDDVLVNSTSANARVELSDVTLNGQIENTLAELTGGELKFNADTFASSKLTVTDGVVNLADSTVSEYVIKELESNGGSYKIDATVSGDRVAVDKLSASGRGTVHISDIVYANGEIPSGAFEAQILTGGDGDLELSLSESITDVVYDLGETVRDRSDKVSSNSSDTDFYYHRSQTGRLQGSIELATTSTANDSISLSANRETNWNGEVEQGALIGDTLALVNGLTADLAASDADLSNRSFTISGESYVSSESVGKTTAGVMSVTSSLEGGSSLDVTKGGFELGSETTLNLSNLVVNGGVLVTTAEGSTNAQVKLSDVTLNGQIENTLAELTGGELKFNADTFASSKLTVTDGVVNLMDSSITEYTIDELASNGGKYVIDVNAAAQTSDTIKANTSSGRVLLDTINFVGGIPSEEFTVQVLKGGNAQLALADKYTDPEALYALGATTREADEKVKVNSSDADTYRHRLENGTLYGSIKLATTKTTNDSIELSVVDEKTDWHGTYQVGELIGDTLALVNSLTAERAEEGADLSNRSFTISGESYVSSESLGVSTAGTMTVNGKTTGSSIDLNGNGGFELNNKTALNLNNVTIGDSTVESGKTLISSNNSDATIALNNTTLNGNISGAGNAITVSGGGATLNGTITNATTTATEGVLSFAADTFKASDLVVDANPGKDLTVALGGDGIQVYEINKLTSAEDANYTFDINLGSEPDQADILKLGAESSGTIKVSGVNFVGGQEPDSTFVVKVIDTTSENVNLKLADAIDGKEYFTNTRSQLVPDIITAEVTSTHKFQQYTQTGEVKGVLNVVKSDGSAIYDSLAVELGPINWNGEKVYSSMGDTLALLNTRQNDTPGVVDVRNFNIDSAVPVYKVGADLGETTEGVLNINGTGLTSAIDLNGNSGFELNNKTALTLNDVTLTDSTVATGKTLISSTNKDATIALNNTTLNGNISGAGNVITVAGAGATLNGTISNATTTLTEGTLKFNADTFASSKLTVTDGVVNLADSKITDYTIDELASNGGKYVIDVNAEAQTADTIKANTSSGSVLLDTINFVGGIPSDEFTVQIIKGGSAQLVLGDKYTGTEYYLGGTAKEFDETVTSSVDFDKVFHTFKQSGELYGSINLATKDSTNDSISLVVSRADMNGEIITTGVLGDTLDLLTTLKTTEDRNFNFKTENDVYNLTTDLGTTTEGKISINGVSDGEKYSTINANKHSLFVLNNKTDLVLSNVSITNAKNVATGTNEDSTITLDNVLLTNNAGGIKTAGDILIKGGTVIADNGKGIEVTSKNSEITLENTGNVFNLVDRFSGVTGAKFNINDGVVNVANKVSNLDIHTKDTTINMLSEVLFNNNSLTVDGLTNMNLVNNAVGTMSLNNLTLKDNINMTVDVDLAGSQMDRLVASSYALGDNFIDVKQLNILSMTDRVRTELPFAEGDLKDNVRSSVSELFTPVWKYGVEYDKLTGNFVFTRGSGSNASDYNPSIMATSVASQLGGYMGMLDTYQNSFMHMDMYMLKPAAMRLAAEKANQYALEQQSAGAGNFRYTSNELNSRGMWYRPYASYDSVGLKHGPSVNSFSYGTFIGGDSEMFAMKNGFHGVISPFVSYMGSHQRYAGNSIYQNGGTLGVTGSFYKGNFFTGITAGVGMSVAEASTMFGNDSFPMLMSGIASKTGYNFEFKEGRYIIQPSLQLSYTFVNTFDYTNAAGVRMDSDPLHAVQILPNVRFIMNTKNGWQPYFTVGVNVNVMGDSQVTAGSTSLPDLSMRPYAQYGIGVQKSIKDRFTAFVQLLIRSGGRNGFATSFGFRYLLGGEPAKKKEGTPHKFQKI